MSHMPVSLISARSAASSSLLRRHERFEVGAADFLLALDQHGDARGDAAAGGVPGAQRFQEHHRLALVVHRAARDEALAVRAVDELRLERRAVPELQRIDRLHVVVAVEQDVRPGVAAGPAGGRPRRDGPRSGGPSARETEPSELVAPPLRGALAVRLCAGCALIEGMRSRSNRLSRDWSKLASTWCQHGVDGGGGGVQVSPCSAEPYRAVTARWSDPSWRSRLPMNSKGQPRCWRAQGEAIAQVERCR